MSEEAVVYRGSPSLMVKAGAISLGVLFIAIFIAGAILMQQPLIGIGAVVALIYLIGVIVAVKQESYEITSQRVRWRRGILTKRTDEMELYRAQDVTIIEPLSLRLVSAGNVRISSGDASTPTLELKAVKNPDELREHLRTHIEECRARKGVRVTEFESPS
jgi:uncharacterized membrane protein YdbT with pleckstrin-like domain